MRIKIWLAMAVGLVIIASIFILDHGKTQEAAVQKKDIRIDLCAISYEAVPDPFGLESALKNYVAQEQIACEKLEALDFRYEDLGTADMAYEIYFLADDAEGTLLTVSCRQDAKRGVVTVDVGPCEYRLDEIKSQAWYEEDWQ